jgi:hypothetical protein
MDAIRQKATQDKEAFDAKITTAIERIAADKKAVHAALRKAKAAQDTRRAGVEKYIDASVAVAQRNASVAKDEQDLTLRQVLKAAAAKWMQELEEARKSSVDEATQVQASCVRAGCRMQVPAWSKRAERECVADGLGRGGGNRGCAQGSAQDAHPRVGDCRGSEQGCGRHGRVCSARGPLRRAAQTERDRPHSAAGARRK